MINVVEDLTVEFSEQANDIINQKIETFVSSMTEKRQSASYYAKNRNTTFDKAKEDIFLGKKSEFFAAAALTKYFDFPQTTPDLEVRKGSKKGWDKDLQYDENHPSIHVKSCSKKTFNYCNDYSWTFQKSNNNGIGGRDEVLDSKDNDLIVLMYLDNPKDKKAIVKAILPRTSIIPYLKLPKKLTLINLKRCLYYQDLLEMKTITSN